MTQQNNVTMFYPFLIKKQKAIAWFFFLIFYADLVATANATKPNGSAGVKYYSNIQGNHKPVAVKSSAGNKMPIPTTTTKSHLNEAHMQEVVQARGLKATKVKGNFIGGPGQPEMATFKSIGADNMVNQFTGDFSYNIPLLDVGGYPVNLFYNAGITMDQEASWVGLGWNLNPGVVNRNMRGMPDDFNGEDKVVKEMSVKPNLTVGVTAGTGTEIVGLPSYLTGSVGANSGITWNSRRGLGMSRGINGSFGMQKEMSHMVCDEKTCKDTKVVDNTTSLSVTASLNVNSMDGVTTSAGLAAGMRDYEKKSKWGLSTDISYNSMQGLTDLKLSAELDNYKGMSKSGSVNLSFARSSFMPSMRMTMTSYNALLGVKFGKEKKVLFKNTDLQGFISDQFIQPSDKKIEKPAVGLMYMDKATGMANAQMDFNRLNDGTYTEKTPVISIPIYTYDVFNISGEGTGGSFRGYRGSVGYVKDYNTVSKSVRGSVNFDVGVKDKAHFGLTLGGAYSQTSVGEWKYNNALKENTRFTPSQADYEGFYFKNPGEKAIIDENYYNAVGQDKLVRPVLASDNGLTGNIFSPSPMLAARYQVFNGAMQADGQIPVNSQLKRYTRDKRSQVISYLTAKEAALVGLDKTIWAYRENTFLPGSCNDPNYKTAFTRYGGSNGPANPRKAHHLSEITVLEGNASRYVYGLPVYTRLQKEVSFSTEGVATGNIIKYKAGENTTMNEAGEEGFFQSQQLQDFAHSFLLTSILSPDYMDVKGDGITDDDLGTAVKFNYSCANLTSQSGTTGFEAYKWRFPFGKINNEEGNWATFSEGLKTDKTDDKAHYTYGTKELWYLHSIESKNVVATFQVSKREDGLQVSNENGGPLNNVVCQRKLERIDLYTKADYAKKLTGGNPVPIKSVFFEYDYDLCKGFGLNNDPNKGKLTLKKIWFTYNGSNKKKNQYVFGYGTQKNGVDLNPNYNTNETDRWGNYKMATSNPANGMSNSDYPYAVQEKAKADAYAAAWCLEKVLLPSGAVLKVDYEADTYSYVQDRRATVVTPIVGFGLNKVATPTNNLYSIPSLLGLSIESLANCALWDHRYVFFEAPQPIQSDAEVKEKYFAGVNQLLLRLWVEVPADDYGSGYEPIFVYGSLKKCGVVTPGGTRFYAELAPTGAGGSPIMETVVDFMRRQLTSKVYPSYKNKNGNALVKVVKATWGMFDQMKKAIKGFEFDFKTKARCQKVDLTRSTGRLTVPNFSKYGGGHRVKSIRIADSWDELTKQGPNNLKVEQASFYGQEYDYSTTATLGTQSIAISSGVATYEPGVGNDENPFREAYKYYETQPLGPTRPETVELPLVETLYPTPMVGYSKVTVRSIHNNSNKKIKSGVGKQVTEFYTAKDFPVQSDFTPFDNQSQRRFKTDPISEIFQFKQKDLLTLTQGVRVVLNDMNGKPKASYSYPEGDDKTVINSTQYIYRSTKVGENKYKLNNVVPVIMDASGVVGNKMIGKDVEVMNDSREHYSYTYSGQLPINGEFFMAGNIPILIPSIFRMQFRDESQYRSATTLKVVNEYGILEKVINNDKGSIVSTENMVYDAETGGVLVSKTNNEFKAPVYNTNYPAHWAETGMEPAYKNIGVTYDNIIFRNGRLENPDVDMNLFESGDELLVIDKAKFGVLAWPCTDGTPCDRLPQSYENHIWALDMRKDPANTAKEFIFIDRNGTPYNGGNVWFKIIRSGKRNLGGASLGSVVTQNNPIAIVNGVDKLVIENSANVINTAAALYKERWKGQDMFYANTSYTQVLRKAPVRLYVAKPTDVTTLAKHRFDQPSIFGGWTTEYYPRYNEDYFHARLRDYGSNKPEITTKSWLQFNLSPITSVHQILSAQLSLYSHDEIANNYSHNMLDPYWPGGMTEHYDYNPHYGLNIFYLKRLMTSWKGTNKAGWVSVFENDLADNNQLVVGGPTQYPYSTQSFCNNCGVGSADNRFEMKSLVEKMIADRDNPQKQYATALQIEMQYRSSDYLTEKRVCFNSGITNSNSPRAPLLSIKYYNCAEAYGLPGNLASPPSGQETVDCINYEWVTTCNSVLTKDFINPYVQGFLGNWRPWRSYVFYGQQREKDPLSATNISKDGVIDGFEPYWVLPTTAMGKMQVANSSKWVWNSEVMQYNRKGAQLEDHDPLERYNAAVYGYQETLPIATANNSRVRQVAFDGFEDYGYQDDPCEPYCKPSKRHFETGVVANSNVLSKEEAHTGQYSYKLDANTVSKAFDLPVGFENTAQDPQLRIAIGNTTTTKSVLNSNGTGLTARYYDTYCFAQGYHQQRISPQVDFTYNTISGSSTGNAPFAFPNGSPTTKVSAFFKGSLQVPATGVYGFSFSSVNEAHIIITPQGSTQPILSLQRKLENFGGFTLFGTIIYETCPSIPDGDVYSGDVLLTAGAVYNIEVRYVHHSSRGGNLQLYWRQPCDDIFELLPSRFLYPEGVTPPQLGNQPVVCYQPSEIKASHALIDGFSLIPGKRMVAGIWVKKGGQDCKCNAYTGLSLDVKDGTQTIGSLQATSKMIEGWQLFEGEFTVPSNITALQLVANKATMGDLFYLDDLRIHPFNANMKSFVYDPQTLWLTSELDENNYASFYEYDDEGTLVRVKKETKDGVKTIKESRSAVQSKITGL